MHADQIIKMNMRDLNTIRKSIHLEQSHLLYTKHSSSIYEWLEISMPYLILYEVASPQNDKSTYFEFSEHEKITHFSTYHDFIALGERPLHSHNFYEMTFVLSGQLKMQIENETVIYQPGDCCLCNKNIHHKEIMDHETEIILFLMKEEFIKEVLATNYFYDASGKAYPLGTFFYNLFSENTKNPFYDAKEYIDFRMQPEANMENFYEVINRIIEEISGVHSGKSHMIKALLCRFIELMEDSSTIKRSTHEATLSNEEQIVLQIASAYRHQNSLFTRHEIEKLTGYNSDYVERIVKRNTGMTLSEYGRNFLLKKAAIMLKETNYGIGKICENLGYSNRNYFNQLFRTYYGVLPSEYRKEQC